MLKRPFLSERVMLIAVGLNALLIYCMYFGLMVLLGGVLGMSLANAVFVDEMTMDNTEALEAKVDDLRDQIADLKQMLENRS